LSYQWIDGNGPDSGGYQDLFVSSATNGRIYNNSDPSASTPVSVTFSDNRQGGLSTVPVYTTNFEAIYQSNTDYTTPGSIGPIYAAECALWLCVQAYDISTTLSKQMQILRGSWTTVFYPNTTADGNWDIIDFRNIPNDFNVVQAQHFR
jgi:hypothetical protein